MSEPFFSVIVPANNAEGYIRKGLEAIRTQDFDDYELIVVCDSCTDNTAKIAMEYSTDLVLCTDFHSCGGARNAGLDIAEGKWILFADDDDWYLPGAFRTLADRLKDRDDIDVLAYGFDWKYKGVALQKPTRLYPAVWSKAWRRDFIGDVRFPVWIHTEDVMFNRQLLPRARIGYLNQVLYYYNFMRKGSISDRIRDGEFDNGQIPEGFRGIAEGYENWLKSREF